MSEKFLKVEDLVVEYRTGGKVVHAVNNVSFELERGKTLGLVGETGAGKTTIAKTILRVLPDAQAKVKSGKVILDGVDLLSLGEAAMRKVRGGQVTMVFQDPMTALNPIMKVGEQIAEVIRKHQTREDKTAREMAEDMLAMVGIPRERYGEYPHQFSGGMRQRAMIAMAMSCNPKVLIADEPTTALDVTIQAQIFELMNQLKKDHETAILLITHDMGVVSELADDVAVMYMGNIIECGSVDEILRTPAHPYTKALLKSIPILGKGSHQDLQPIKGSTPDPFDRPTGCQFAPRCEFSCEKCNQMPGETMVDGTHMVRCFKYKEVMNSGK